MLQKNLYIISYLIIRPMRIVVETSCIVVLSFQVCHDLLDYPRWDWLLHVQVGGDHLQHGGGHHLHLLLVQCQRGPQPFPYDCLLLCDTGWERGADCRLVHLPWPTNGRFFCPGGCMSGGLQLCPGNLLHVGVLLLAAPRWACSRLTVGRMCWRGRGRFRRGGRSDWCLPYSITRIPNGYSHYQSSKDSAQD